MKDLWTKLKPFLLIGFVGAFWGAAKGFLAGLYGVERIDWLIIPHGLESQMYFLDRLPRVVDNWIFFGLLIILLLSTFIWTWFYLLQRLGVSLGWKTIRETSPCRNIARAFFLLFVPLFLWAFFFGTFFRLFGSEEYGEGRNLFPLNPENMLWYGAIWVIIGWWIRLAEQRRRPLLRHWLLATLLSLLGGLLSLVTLVAATAAKENLLALRSGFSFLSFGLGGLAGGILSYALSFFFLFLLITLLAGLLLSREKSKLGIGLLVSLLVFLVITGTFCLCGAVRGYGHDILSLAGIPHQATVKWGSPCNKFFFISKEGTPIAPDSSLRYFIFPLQEDTATVIGVTVHPGEVGKISFSSPAGLLPFERMTECLASTQNLDKLQAFLDGEYSRRKLGYPGWAEIQRQIGDNLFAFWKTEEGREALHRITPSYRGFGCMTVITLKDIGQFPLTSRNLNYLTELSDERRYFIGPSQKLFLTKAWLHAGEIGRARRFKEDCLKSSAWLKKSAEKILIPNDPPLTKGRIQGSILLSGKPFNKGKVGLFTCPPNTPLSDYNLFSGQHLVDAKALSADGSFAFRDLAEGEYVLALLTDSFTIPGELVAIWGNPGLIKLSRERPVAYITPIKVSLSLPYDETKVRYRMLDESLRLSPGDNPLRTPIYYQGFDVNALEAIRRLNQGIRVANTQDFERKSLGWVLTRRGSEEKINGKGVRLTTDTQ